MKTDQDLINTLPEAFRNNIREIHKTYPQFTIAQIVLLTLENVGKIMQSQIAGVQIGDDVIPLYDENDRLSNIVYPNVDFTVLEDVIYPLVLEYIKKSRKYDA